MRKFKNIMFIILALAPAMTFLACLACGIFSNEEQGIIRVGDVTITDSNNGVSYSCEDGTWAEYVLEPLLPNEPVEGIFGSIGRLLLTVSDSAGIAVNTPVVLAVAYMTYMFVVELLMALFAIITFVPRKCKEIFQ